MAHTTHEKNIAKMDEESIGNKEKSGVVSGIMAELIDPAIERSMKRKTDLILLPMLSVMYLFK